MNERTLYFAWYKSVGLHPYLYYFKENSTIHTNSWEISTLEIPKVL